jgi:xanthine dehydrogenase accessory factor
MSRSSQAKLIWIHGAGEQASGVALRLVQAGYLVVAAEIAAPTAVRRLVSFCEAVYEDRIEVAGIEGVLISNVEEAEVGRVNVMVDPEAEGLAGSGAVAVVDARLTKRSPGTLPHGDCPLIGLGPGFEVGRNADVVIETHREAGPGKVITQGCAMAHTGVPGVIEGESIRRVLRAPGVGRMVGAKQLGDLVNEGEIVGCVDGEPVRALFDGRIRGLIHPDVDVHVGMKIGDVDPRGIGVDGLKVSGKALSIGDGVLEGLRVLGL